MSSSERWAFGWSQRPSNENHTTPTDDPDWTHHPRGSIVLGWRPTHQVHRTLLLEIPMDRHFSHCQNEYKTSCEHLGCVVRAYCMDEAIKQMTGISHIHTTSAGIELWLGAEPEAYFNIEYDLVVNCNGYWPTDGVFIGEARFHATCPVLMFPFRDDGSLRRIRCGGYHLH